MRRHLLLERAAECAPEKRSKARICSGGGGRYDDMKILWLCMCAVRRSRARGPCSFKHESRILGQWSNPVSASRNARSLSCSIMKKPNTGLDECQRILLKCLRSRNSDPSPTSTFSACVTALSGFRTLTAAAPSHSRSPSRLRVSQLGSLDPKSESEIKFVRSKKRSAVDFLTLAADPSILQRRRAANLNREVEPTIDSSSCGSKFKE